VSVTTNNPSSPAVAVLRKDHVPSGSLAYWTVYCVPGIPAKVTLNVPLALSYVGGETTFGGVALPEVTVTVTVGVTVPP